MRWVQYSRVSSQRAAVLLSVVAAASESRGTTLEGLATASSALLRAHATIPPERTGAVAEYLTRQRLWKRYPSLRDPSPAGLLGHRIELQDLWLSDKRLPSASGAITDTVVNEPALLAVSLRLVRANNHTLTDRGKALRAIGPSAIKALRDKDTTANPLLIPTTTGVALLYALLDADFDFVQSAYRAAAPILTGTFSRVQFGRYMEEACLELRRSWLKRVRTGEQRQQLARLAELANSIADAPKAKTRGGARPPENTATLRLEPYVDLGLLGRKNRYDYDYFLSEGQNAFFTALATADDPARFIDDELVGRYLETFGRKGTRAEHDEIWEAVRSAYSQLRSGLGYASFKEVMLVAIGLVIAEGRGHYFEVSDGIGVLKEQQRRTPKSLRFGVARGGGLRYVRILERDRT
jgi:hypothetical protein